MNDALHHGLEAAAVDRLAGGEGQCAHRAAVEGAVEADELLAAGVVPGELDGGLDGLSARVAEEGERPFLEGGDLVQAFAQPDLQRVIEVRRNVNKAVRLLLNGRDDFGVAVAGGGDGDAGSEVDEAVAVHVPDLGALAVVHHKGVGTWIRRRDDDGVSFEDLAGLRTGQVIGLHKPTPPRGSRCFG